MKNRLILFEIIVFIIFTFIILKEWDKPVTNLTGFLALINVEIIWLLYLQLKNKNNVLQKNKLS